MDTSGLSAEDFRQPSRASCPRDSSLISPPTGHRCPLHMHSFVLDPLLGQQTAVNLKRTIIDSHRDLQRNFREGTLSYPVGTCLHLGMAGSFFPYQKTDTVYVFCQISKKDVESSQASLSKWRPAVSIVGFPVKRTAAQPGGSGACL